MNIYLINPITSYTKEEVSPPMGLLALASYIDDVLNIRPKIIDFDLLNKEENATQKIATAIKKLKDVKADIYGFTCMYHNILEALDLAQEIKAMHPESNIIFGGPHVSFLSKELLEKFAFIDFIVRNEGEVTFRELIENLGREEELTKIQGLSYRTKNGDIRENPKRPLIENLDELPFLDYNFVDLPRYLFINPNIYLPLLVGSGCPFKCSFCSTSLMWIRKYRVKTPERILREMFLLNKEYGISQFDFVHDNFTFNRKYIKEFSALLKQYRFRFKCSSRCDQLNEEIVCELKEAGLEGIFFGVETGSERLQKEVSKHLKLHTVQRSQKLCKAFDIKTTYSFIYGFPQETYEEFDQTIRMAFSLKVKGSERVNVHLLSLHPGTQLHDTYSLDTEHFDEYRSSIYEITVKKDEYLELIHTYPDLFKSYFLIKHEKFSYKELLVYQVYDMLLHYFSYSFWYLFIHRHFRPSNLEKHMTMNEIKTILQSSKNNNLILDHFSSLFFSLKNFFALDYVFQDLLTYEMILFKLSAIPSPYSMSSQNQDVYNSFIELPNGFTLFRSHFDIMCFLEEEKIVHKPQTLLFRLNTVGKIEIFESNRDVNSTVKSLLKNNTLITQNMSTFGNALGESTLLDMQSHLC